MNATELLFYVQSQMGMPSANTASSSDAKKPSFHDQLQQKQDSIEKPTEQKPQENPDASGNHTDEIGGTQSTELDPYRQQLLAAAVMAQNFVDMTDAQAEVQPQADMAVAQPAVLNPTEQPTQMVPEGTLNQPQNTADVATQQTADMVANGALPETKMAQPQDNTFAQGASVEQPTTLETAVHAATQAQDEPQDGDAQLGQPTQRKQEQTEVVGSAQKETPVFHEVKAAPVKVGDTQTVDTQSSDMDTQLVNHLKDALKNGDQRVEIQLTPENLGSVTVQLTRSADGTLHVALNATGEKATALLEKHATGLENLLASTNRSAVQVEVQHQQESGQSQNGHPFDREGQNGQQQQQQQQNHRQPQDRQDFMQQLRLGLIPLDAEIS